MYQLISATNGGRLQLCGQPVPRPRLVYQSTDQHHHTSLIVLISRVSADISNKMAAASSYVGSLFHAPASWYTSQQTNNTTTEASTASTPSGRNSFLWLPFRMFILVPCFIRLLRSHSTLGGSGLPILAAAALATGTATNKKIKNSCI